MARARAVRRPVGIAQRVFDARPDRVDFRDLPYRPPLRSLPPAYPDDRQIARLVPAYVAAGLVRDQGTEGACTGFGLACVVNYLLWMRHLERGGQGRFASVSPRMLYELARRYDEWPGERYEGSSCRGALKGWHKHGVCSERHWPYTMKADGTPVFTPPIDGWESDALARTLGVYYRVDRASIVDLQAAIVNIGAVYVSARVHAGWDDVLHARATPAPRRLRDIPDIPVPKKTGPLGGHAFALVGYDARGFIVQNSWGRVWGASGFARLLYADWVAHGTDAWACALGVPADASAARVSATRWRIPSGLSLGQLERTTRAAGSPPDDPWPVDHDFDYAPYQPLGTAVAYQHTLVTGNDGELAVRDLTKGGARAEADHARDIVFERPFDWLRSRPKGPVKLALYAHGGLNGEDESIRRIRVLAPYFLANHIYPVFLTWRTGPGETIRSLVADWFRRIPGADREKEAGLGEWLADQKDRALEAAARPFGRGIWSEMRENAERGMRDGHGLDLLVAQLGALGTALAQTGRALEVHAIGHSAGAILLGHLLERMLAAPAAGLPALASCTLYAPACSVRFTVQRYGAAADQGVLPLNRLWLAYLTDENEKRDALPSPTLGIYGKSLLYLVSRALDDERKMPLLGMARAHEPKYANDSDQWADTHLPDVRLWQRAWRAAQGHTKRTTLVEAPTVRQTRVNGRIQATHGSFDNNIDVLTATLERIRGATLVRPMEWLDY
ncbi:MAG: C1 family peptidase [Acidobacteriota bacterium]